VGVIIEVIPGSRAARAGLRAGMKIVQVNEMEIRDIISWKQALAFPSMQIAAEVAGARRTYLVRHRSGEDIGVVFATATLDELHTCENNCLFCFVKQMPPGQRQSLYVKDDDYRLSLVYGSFVTLTNIPEEEWRRLLQEGISPIYVSVHSTNPKLRVEIMGNPRAAMIMEQVRELVAHGISVHVQLVLIPGTNDGAELERSIADLVALHPGVDSIAVVPVGLTGHRQGLPELNRFNKDSAREVLLRLEKFRVRARRKFGRTLVYAADEFYVLAETDFPRSSSYDDFPQLENGVGISRLFRDDFLRTLAAVGQRRRPESPVLWVTGMASAICLQRLQHEINARHQVFVDVLTVPNLLFGGGVTVTGLLGGRDIALALSMAQIFPRTRVLIPDITLREGKFLDDTTFLELQSSFPELILAVCRTTGEDLVKLTLGLKE